MHSLRIFTYFILIQHITMNYPQNLNIKANSTLYFQIGVRQQPSPVRCSNKPGNRSSMGAFGARWRDRWIHTCGLYPGIIHFFIIRLLKDRMYSNTTLLVRRVSFHVFTFQCLLSCLKWLNFITCFRDVLFKCISCDVDKIFYCVSIKLSEIMCSSFHIITCY